MQTCHYVLCAKQRFRFVCIGEYAAPAGCTFHNKVTSLVFSGSVNTEKIGKEQSPPMIQKCCHMTMTALRSRLMQRFQLQSAVCLSCVSRCGNPSAVHPTCRSTLPPCNSPQASTELAPRNHDTSWPKAQCIQPADSTKLPTSFQLAHRFH